MLLNHFKHLIFLTIFFLGIFLIIEGNYNLKKVNKVILIDKKIEIKKDINIKSKLKLQNIKNKNLDNTLYIEEIINVKKNDTFSKILSKFIKDTNFKNRIIYATNKKLDLKNLNINQKIYFYLDNNKKTKKIIISIDFFNELIIELNDDKIDIFNKKIKYTKEINSLDFKINSSLYQDGIKAGLPLSILTDAIRLYSFDLDFQRDIKKNTTFQISYEKLYNDKRNEVTYRNIEYINLIIENKKIEYFIFKTNDGFYDYFNEEGKNVKKSLLKTPIDGAKLSSNFGMRKHPISGFNKLHKGVDFAAPIGTPVYSGGNGIIDYIGRNGSYGKYIRIRHNNEYKTAYAHLSNFKKGVVKGKRVSQGEVIAYVGTTGKSTGPHLHYEILYKNKQINPMKMKLPSGKILKGKELEKFQKNAKNIYAKYLFTLYE